MTQPQHAPWAIASSQVEFANNAFYLSLWRLCQNDRLLSETIRSARAGGACGQVLILEINQERLESAYKKIFRIARLIVLLGANFKFIDINGHNISLDSLIKLQPAISNVKEGVFDRLRNMEQAVQLAQRYRALLGYATSKATVFVVSTSGIYKDVHLRQGVVSKIPPEQMINRPLDEVLPSMETALYLIRQIQESYRLNECRQIQYGLWNYQYEAQIIPIQGAEEVVLVCNRLN